MIENKNKTISVKITDSEFDKLVNIADNDGRSVSATVRLLIINLLNGNIEIQNRVEGTAKLNKWK